jgi:short-subunit dehydrogenase involved in D-alanine esterification of teichoic acids
MAHILILGASSQIGQELALKFSPSNTLYLVGRNSIELDLISKKCLDNGANSAIRIIYDLSNRDESIFESTKKFHLDLIINAASATSRVEDNFFKPEFFEDYVFSDLLTPIRLAGKMSTLPEKMPDIIFISSVLSLIKSRNKEIYSALKRLQEMYLQCLFDHTNGGSLLIVRVGKRISHVNASLTAKDLANKIYQNYQLKKSFLNYGREGRIYLFLFYLQPILMQWIINLHRLIRAK